MDILYYILANFYIKYKIFHNLFVFWLLYLDIIIHKITRKIDCDVKKNIAICTFFKATMCFFTPIDSSRFSVH